ncbi:MAG: enoyl-CoA hydratase/isomerase family protein, partial [Candidatus Binataceae bacterium]
MANYETIIFETVEDKIRRLTLNRPEKLNAMSQKLLGELDQVLSDFENDASASVLIIRGAGRAFCAGYDLQFTQGSGSGFTVHNDRTALQKAVDRWQRLWALPKPVIAQVHGYCLAGATELAGHCDLVFASDDAQFGHPAGRSLGILPTLSMWPILMGPRKAKEYFFTGDLMGDTIEVCGRLFESAEAEDVEVAIDGGLVQREEFERHRGDP